MGNITTWMTEQQQAAEAQLVIDDTLGDLLEREKFLDQYMPMEMYRDRNFIAYIVERLQTIASVIGYGAEPPTTQAAQMQKLRGQLIKSGLSFDYPEELQWKMQEAMNLAMLQGSAVQDMAMADGSVIEGSNPDLASYLFKTVADMTLAQINLLDALTWMALQFGEISWTDPRTNTSQFIDYKDPDQTYDHFPADLSGSELWTNYQTANGLAVIEQDVEEFSDIVGKPPDAIVMSRQLKRHLRNQESTRQALASISSNATGTTVNVVGSIGMQELDTIMDRREMPRIVTFDEMYQIEATNKRLSNARFLNTNRYTFLTKGMGVRAMGPTLESDGERGIYVVTREIRNFPPQDATQGVATLLPVIPNPKLLFSRKVA